MSAVPRTFRTVSGTLIDSVAKLPAKLESFSDRALTALQRNLLDLLTPAAATPIIGGNLFIDVAFTSGTNVVVQHRLGRAYVGVIVLAPDAAARIKRVAQTASLDDRQVTLQSDATCTASVYVF